MPHYGNLRLIYSHTSSTDPWSIFTYSILSFLVPLLHLPDLHQSSILLAWYFWLVTIQNVPDELELPKCPHYGHH